MDKKDIATVTADGVRQGLRHAPCYKTPVGYNDNSYLEKLCREGLRKRYGINDVTRPEGNRERTVIDRLNCELKSIEQTGFAGHFLVVWDVVTANRKKNIIIGPGRGAEAGSLVCYLLGITGVDPLKYRLFMERFINPERVCQPDFMLDSCEYGRYAIIDYVKNRYGRDKTATIFTLYDRDLMPTILDIGRAQRVPPKNNNHILRIIQEAVVADSQYSSLKLKALYHELSNDPAARNIMDHVYTIEELCRGPEFDASRIVIGNKPLKEMIPVGVTKTGDLIALNTAEKIGFMTMYITGSKTLVAISMTLQILKKKGVRLNIELIPLDDPKSFKSIHNGNTFEIFQHEDSDIRNVVHEIFPVRFEHLIACVALCRLGPANFLNDYIARKAGKIKIHYDHPLLEPILNETYGIWIYQEQIMETARVLAGYTLGQGDLFRRMLCKRRPDDIQQQRATFIDGCRKLNNIPGKKANKIFDNMCAFAGFLFNKAHAVCYATMAYQMAYLKAHYPKEFSRVTEEISTQL